MFHIVAVLLHAYALLLRTIVPVVPYIWAGTTGWFANSAYRMWKIERAPRYTYPSE